MWLTRVLNKSQKNITSKPESNLLVNNKLISN